MVAAAAPAAEAPVAVFPPASPGPGDGDSTWLLTLDQPVFLSALQPFPNLYNRFPGLTYFCLKYLEGFVFPIGHERIKNA